MTAPTRSYLVVNENFNAGWQASLGGARLRAVRIDGWKQAWLLPAGTAGTVTLTYAPDALYRDAIFGGLGRSPWSCSWRSGHPPRPGCGRIRRPRWLTRRGPAMPPGQTLPGPAMAEPARRRLPVRSGRGFGAALTSAAAVCGLLLAGLWLGGYPGAAILTSRPACSRPRSATGPGTGSGSNCLAPGSWPACCWPRRPAPWSASDC